MSPEQIKSALEATLETTHVQVEVEGSHVHLLVVSPAFDGLNAVKKQQLVYATLNDAIASGAIHAVHMKTFTPEQWANHTA